MAACFPDAFVDLLSEKCPPDSVHTLVIWTKNPANLFFYKKLASKLHEYDQLFVHLTVTGMGGSEFEPNVPAQNTIMRMLPELTKLVGSPDRIRFRFDPIVHFFKPDRTEYTNLHWFEKLAPVVAGEGIRNISTSWISPYKKVTNRLKRLGITIKELTSDEFMNDLDYLNNVVRQNELTLHFCSMEHLPRSRCIDGAMLNNLHPLGYQCSVRKAKGQRTSCGCTESLDIGWYFKCPHGCVYCYANPALNT
ncbi:DUF1848 family protein [candidate division KSB1 bacterium]|nr:DUF1848 family protein [candidate division KSB1 bacterium]